ncbi:MAG: hypothetical protein ACWA5L_00530 [bacterium]
MTEFQIINNLDGKEIPLFDIQDNILLTSRLEILTEQQSYFPCGSTVTLLYTPLFTDVLSTRTAYDANLKTSINSPWVSVIPLADDKLNFVFPISDMALIRDMSFFNSPSRLELSDFFNFRYSLPQHEFYQLLEQYVEMEMSGTDTPLSSTTISSKQLESLYYLFSISDQNFRAPFQQSVFRKLHSCHDSSKSFYRVLYTNLLDEFTRNQENIMHTYYNWWEPSVGALKTSTQKDAPHKVTPICLSE